MSCKDISADWAAQRIKGLSLASAIVNALVPKRTPKDKSKIIKTLIDTFRYPRKGPGMMWEACAERVRTFGGRVLMGEKVVGCFYDVNAKMWTLTHVDSTGARHTTVAHHVISSAPLRELAQGLKPELSPEAIAAAARLKYRDFLTVVLILKDKNQFSDNWIYIHDPAVHVGRVQNFKSWSPEMVPDPSMCCYGLEYFCFEGDGVWTAPDQDLIELGKKELEHIGLSSPGDVTDGCVVRQPKAYPVYDDDYAANVERIRSELQERFPTLHLVGRNGMHKYNNQDHAMMTAMLCVKNIIAGSNVYDLWQVNQDAEYHEAGERGAETASSVSGLRQVPKRVSASLRQV
jgi:protoporphyrinogen oxidase